MSTKKRIITGTNAVVVIIVTIVSAVLLNAIAAQLSVSWDLTEEKIYTLSEASAEAVRELEEPVVVKAFISPDMPPPYHNLAQNISDLLADYERESGGKLSYQIITPAGDDEQVEEAARGYGIEKVGIGQQSEDEVSLRAVYKGIAFVQGDEIEVIEDLQTTGNPETDNFEYEFTKALLNLQDTEPRVVAFMSGFGGPADVPSFTGNISPVFEQLYGDLIEVRTIDLSAETVVPEDVEALVILNVSEPVGPKAKFAIDQFVQRGGSVGWYQSATVLDQQVARQLMQQMGPNAPMPNIRKPVSHDLSELFAHYGLTLHQDIVLDRENALALGFVMTEHGAARVSHPASFLMTDIDKTLPFTRSIPAMAMPGPASISVRPSALEDEDVEVVEVVTTAETSVRRTEPPRTMNYQEFIEPQKGEQPGPFVLAAALQGDIPSYYTDHPLPDGIEESQLVADQAPARILVVGSGEFFQPRPDIGFNEQLAAMGGQFFISSIEWLVQDNALTQIRGKSMPRLIGEVPRAQQRRIQYVNIAMVPALFGMVGWLVMRLRSRRRSKIEESMRRGGSA